MFSFRRVRFGLLPALFAAWLPLAGLAQTNEAAEAARREPEATAQIWDLGEELKFTDAQKESMAKIHAEYDAALKAMRRATAADAPPDVKQAARQAYADKFRAVNRRIGELLTEEQKTALAKLRRARRGAAMEEKGASEDETPATDTARRAPRPLLTDQEYQEQAAALRAAYAKPAKDWPAAEIDPEVKPHYVELGLLPPVVYPTNNPYSDAKAELGKKLFFDPRLSGSGQIACASCHDPDLAWSDGRTVSFGHNRKATRRNAPSLLNVGQQSSFFWDGRATSLEEQAHDVIVNEDEMRGGFAQVRDGLGRIEGYTNDFAQVFGTPEVTLPRAAKALATFVRTITSRGNSFDSFLRGETNALSDSAVRGLHLFRTTARCANCHHGPNFTDGKFHDEGLSYYGRKLEDLGRYEVTKAATDVGAFKTPSLRNIARTGPYMHVGLFDLDGVLNLYNAGMPTLKRKASQKNDPLFPTKSKLLQPLGLNKQDLADLKAFLESLTETRARVRPPELPAALANGE